MDIQYEKLISELDVGIVIVDKEHNIHYWNRWLAINSGITKEKATGAKITELFNMSNKDVDVLNRHIKGVLLLKSPSYYTAQVNHYFIPIKHKSFTKTNFTDMQQDVTVFPYDPKNNQVGLLIYDQTILMDVQKKLELEIKKRMEQEQLMIEEARFVSMSQMIQNISHHWRQPLNALSLLIQELEIVDSEKELDRDYLLSTVKKSTSIIEDMSQTIDNFRNYFQSDEAKVKFLAQEAVYKTLSLVSLNADQNKINIHIEAKESVWVESYISTYSQALFNIINNVIDMLTKNRGEDNRHIVITIEKNEDNNSKLSIFSNGGQVEKEVLDKIFEPYSTTKSKYNLSNISFYMTKVIVERNMQGEISVKDHTHKEYGDGLSFIIEL